MDKFQKLSNSDCYKWREAGVAAGCGVHGHSSIPNRDDVFPSPRGAKRPTLAADHSLQFIARLRMLALCRHSPTGLHGAAQGSLCVLISCVAGFRTAQSVRLRAKALQPEFGSLQKQDFFSSGGSIPTLEPSHFSVQFLPVSLSPGVERLGCEANHLRPSSIEIRNEGNVPKFPSTPSWRGV
jgi:hypothetical protein